MAKNWVMAPFSYDARKNFDQVWKYDRENNVISIGWDVEAFDSRQELESKYRETARVNERWTETGLSQLIQFWYDIKSGDRIIARGGRKKIVGVGTVTGAPFYSPNMRVEQAGSFKADHAYFLPVEWNDSEREFPKITFGMHTLYSVRDDQFEQLVNGRITEANLWDEYVRRAKAFVATGKLESEETEYKVRIGQELAVARKAVLEGADD